VSAAGEIEMKRIELVIEPAALDRLTESAQALKLSDFDVTEVRRAPRRNGHDRQRLYRGRASVVGLVDRLRVDLTVADDEATQIVHEMIENVQPESIAVLKLDH
jgi:nitrogen regulatory protein PII